MNDQLTSNWHRAANSSLDLNGAKSHFKHSNLILSVAYMVLLSNSISWKHAPAALWVRLTNICQFTGSREDWVTVVIGSPGNPFNIWMNGTFAGNFQTQSWMFIYILCACVCVCAYFFRIILYVNCFVGLCSTCVQNIIFRLICIMWVLRVLTSAW